MSPEIDLERLYADQSVYACSEQTGEKRTGVLPTVLGVAPDHTLAAMIPWHPGGLALDEPSNSSNHSNGTVAAHKAPPPPRTSPTASAARYNIILREEELTAAALRAKGVWGYGKLSFWMQERFSRESCSKIDAALGSVRPKFLEITRSLSEKQLLQMERQMHDVVRHYKQSVFDYVPFPMLLVNRTGEIYGGNEHASQLLQIPIGRFSDGQLFHFQLVKEQDIVRVIDVSAPFWHASHHELTTAPSCSADVCGKVPRAHLGPLAQLEPVAAAHHGDRPLAPARRPSGYGS